MSATTRRYSKDEIAERGETLYENSIRASLPPGSDGKFLAIDIESGAYEIGSDEIDACDRLRARVPTAQIWLKQIGSSYLHRLEFAFRKADRLRMTFSRLAICESDQPVAGPSN
jgi:hypothetical protein